MSKLTFEDLLCEDGAGVLRPHPLTLVDLCGSTSKIQQTDGTAPKTLPYPGEFVLEELSDVYIAAGKLHARLNEVKNNALFSTNKEKQKRLDKATTTLFSIKKLCKILAKQLDSLTIDKMDKH